MSEYFTESDIRIARDLVRHLAEALADMHADIAQHHHDVMHGPEPDAVPPLGESDDYRMHVNTVDTYHRQVLDFLSRAWDWVRQADPDRAGSLVHLADFPDIRRRIEEVLAPMARDRRRSAIWHLREAANEVIKPLLADLTKAEAIVGPRWMEVFQATWAARNPTTAPGSTPASTTAPPASSKTKTKARPKGGRPRHPDGHGTEKEVYTEWMSGKHPNLKSVANELAIPYPKVRAIIKRCNDRVRTNGNPFLPDSK